MTTQLETTGPTTELVWDQFAGALRGYLRNRVGEPELAEDLLQDVFVRVHDRIDQLRDDERISGWVHRIARNVIADHYRRERPSEAFAGDSAGDTPELENIDEKALAMWVASTVATLPDHYREAIELTELGGLTQQEAADRLGLSLSGMKSRVQRGRKQLEQILLRCCHVELDRQGGVVDYKRRSGRACSCDEC